MNAFRKNSGVQPYLPSGGSYSVSSYHEVDFVSASGAHQVTVEEKVLPVEDYSKTIVTPTSEQYSLANILATGQVPQTVNVSGMLPSDESPDVLGTFGALKDMEKSFDKPAPEPTPAPAPAEPAPAQS